jgi:thiamine-monophosphate kinase
MKVSEIGEFGLIDILAEMVDQAKDRDALSWKNLVAGIGDDVAAWRCGKTTVLGKTDSLVQNVHFTTDIFLWEDVGWKALAVNLSDKAVTGGSPRYALVALSLPPNAEVDDIKSLYRGMIALARQAGVAIVGGNISRAPVVVIDVMVIGEAGDKSGRVLTRSTARPGDKIAVTGYPGTAAAGLEALTKRIKLDPGTLSLVSRAFLNPTPRLAEGRILLTEGVKAAIDISDGLVADLRHICQRSQVGARLDIETVPVHPLVRESFQENYMVKALSGGEDYELLFTASEDVVKRVQAKTSCPVTVIGEVTSENPGEVALSGKNGESIITEGMGWDHFKIKS